MSLPAPPPSPTPSVAGVGTAAPSSSAAHATHAAHAAHAAATTPAARPARTASSDAGRRFGRFELRKLLGKSERAMVWLVHDSLTKQESMLTLPRTPPADDAALQRWLHQVRHVLRLDHPRLAGGAEVGVHEHWPFLAVDRRRGITLGEWLAMNARPSPQVAVGWLAQALEGLAFVHDAGMAHGDLQLHSLLVDEQGNLRVMAFATAGVAVSAAAHDSPKLTPRDVAERDVLACGLLLHELLAGEPPLDEADITRVIERMAPLGREAVRLPWATPQPVPATLRVIVNRASSSQQRQRYLNARTLLRALQGWSETEGQDRGGPLALLIDRLSTVGHLPAMPGAAARVERLLRREGQHVDAIAEEILQDMALCFELLRQVNAAQVQHALLGGGTPVLTIRRCVAMLGLDGVRRAARSLRKWPGPLPETGAAAMDKTVQLVRLAALTAQRLRPAGYDPEVVYLVTVLQNLGRLLVQYHFHDEAEQIRQLMQPQPAAPPSTGKARAAAQPGMNEAEASLAVLGVDIDALGSAVARHWGMGDEVLHMSRPLPLLRPVPAPDADAELLRITASAANEAVDAMLRNDTPQAKKQAMATVAQRYARSLGLTMRDLQEALRDARSALQRGAAVGSSGSSGSSGRSGSSEASASPAALDTEPRVEAAR